MMSSKKNQPDVLIVKNTLTEGPGTIENFLRQHAISYRILEIHAGDMVPPLESYSHLVVLGGPMAVYEMQQYPYLTREASMIEDAIKAGKPVLGVCLGAQMLAHVLGARVYPGARKEIGWYDVDITDDGMSDICMVELTIDGGKNARVFQWHGDTFDLPQGSVRLASSFPYPNQAFRFAETVYGLQFHIEVTPGIVHEWLKEAEGVDLAAIDADSRAIFGPYLGRAQAFYRSFFSAGNKRPKNSQ